MAVEGGVSPRRRNWQTVLLMIVLAGVGYAAGFGTALVVLVNHSADEQFKKIADEKEARLKELLASKGSELRHYLGTVSEETDIQKKIDYPYLGKIAFSYEINKPEDRIHVQYLNTATALYRYSNKDKQWEYQGCSEEGVSSEFVKPEEQIVQFRDVRQVFQK